MASRSTHLAVRRQPAAASSISAPQAALVQPGVGRGVLGLGDRVEQVAVEFGDAQGMEAAEQREEARLVRRDRQIGDAEDERLVAFVGAAVEQVGRLGVGAGHDDARHAA